MHTGFILRIQIRRYYDDWQLEENGKCCLIQSWKGLGGSGRCFFPSLAGVERVRPFLIHGVTNHLGLGLNLILTSILQM